MPAPGPGLDPTILAMVRQIVEPLADADKHRSDNETQRYSQYLQTWDHVAERGARWWRQVAWQVFIVIAAVLLFAFAYSWHTGSAALATHAITAILAFLGGLASGYGLGGRQQNR